MLRIVLPGGESYDYEREEFVYAEETVLYLEHSLRSIREWESHCKKPFLTDIPKYKKTENEWQYYIYCMIQEPKNMDPRILSGLTSENRKAINDYINEKRTATWVNTDPEKNGGKQWGKSIAPHITTTEQIYAAMVGLQIPFEAENWNLNQLLMLITVVNENNKKADPKNKHKPSRINQAKSRAELNAMRRSEQNSTG